MPQPARYPQQPQQPRQPAQQQSQDSQADSSSGSDSGADSDESAFVHVSIGPSSQIASVNYNPKTLDLIIQFATNGSTYLYKNVDQVIVSGLASAESPGRFFAQNIRGGERFDYERMD